VKGYEADLKLMHWKSTSRVWEDVTTWVDSINNNIYGKVKRFSIFAIIMKTPEEGDGGDGGDGDKAAPKYLVLTLLSEIIRSVTPGTKVNVTLSITDRSGKGIESVNVTINIGNVTTVVCEDMGNGNYQGIIDTSRLSSCSYLIVITATKSYYAETSISFILTVRSSVLDFVWELLEEPLYMELLP
jgi:hypothetical protein